jgi:hypothetical protein
MRGPRWCIALQNSRRLLCRGIGGHRAKRGALGPAAICGEDHCIFWQVANTQAADLKLLALLSVQRGDWSSRIEYAEISNRRDQRTEGAARE